MDFGVKNKVVKSIIDIIRSILKYLGLIKFCQRRYNKYKFKMKTIEDGCQIIRPWYGGLGDSLQHSTLPERFSELGHEVYISGQTPFRNNEIYDLVWGSNPYVKGLSDQKPNAGDIPGNEYHDTEGEFIKNWERIHGLEPKNSYPKIYYNPQIIDDVKDKILIDITVMSLKNNIFIKPIMDHMCAYDGEKIAWLKLKEKVIKNSYNPNLPYGAINVKDIFHYCDLISSCKKFICSFSGGMVLSSALNHDKSLDIECLTHDTPQMLAAWNTGIYLFNNINYIKL